jgi:chaperonin GroES
MTIKPLADRVVVKAVEAEEKTKSGLILTASAQEKPQVAEVVAVGPGGIVDGKEVVMVVKVGDKVISSGVGSIYPEGFEIGEIVEIKSDSVSRTLIAKIKLSADLTSLTKVMVLTGIKED